MSERSPVDPPGDPDTTSIHPVAATDGEVGPPPVLPRGQVRRVRRVLRRIDPLSMLKVSLIFFVCMYGVIVVSSLLVWRAAVTSGIVDDLESFVVDLGFNDFSFAPEQMFRALLFGGGGMIFVATFLTVLGTVLFNLISDLVGGVKISMIEEQLVEPEHN